jgi:hypothetical protein
MPTIYQSGISCGIRQIAEVWRFRRSVAKLRTWVNNRSGEDVPGWALKPSYFYMFSDADHIGNGRWLAEMIRKHNLGVLSTPIDAKENPNTNNLISMWIWRYNGNIIPRTPRKKTTVRSPKKPRTAAQRARIQ